MEISAKWRHFVQVIAQVISHSQTRNGCHESCLYSVTRGGIDVRRHNQAGSWFNIKMISFQYRKSHCGDKTILWPSYLHSGISFTGKMTSLYGIRPQPAWTLSYRASGIWPTIHASRTECVLGNIKIYLRFWFATLRWRRWLISCLVDDKDPFNLCIQ